MNKWDHLILKKRKMYVKENQQQKSSEKQMCFRWINRIYVYETYNSCWFNHNIKNLKAGLTDINVVPLSAA